MRKENRKYTKNRRIAIMVHNLQGGGMERVAAQVSEMLQELGFNVYLFVWDFDKRNSYKYSGNIVRITRKTIAYGNEQLQEVLQLWNDILQFRKEKIAYKIDITISFAPVMNIVNLLTYTRDKKILTVHSCLSVRKDLKGLRYSGGVMRLYNLAYKVIAVSEWCRKDLIQNYGIDKTKVKVIYNPIEWKECAQGINNNVLVVGRLQDVKQQWHIIRAFRMVLNKVPDAKLIIAGKGENERYLKRLTEMLDMKEHVEFKGFVKDIDALYQEARVVVFSSESEAFPCAVIEAIGHGLPVVAANCPGGIAEIIAATKRYNKRVESVQIEKCGILVPTLDGIKYKADVTLINAERLMAEGIITLLTNQDLWNKMSASCKEIRERFSRDTIKKSWEKLLR